MSRDEIRECLRYANECAREARALSDPKLRQDLIDMQLRWLSIARSYEFLERLDFLSGVEVRNREAREMLEKAAG